MKTEQKEKEERSYWVMTKADETRKCILKITKATNRKPKKPNMNIERRGRSKYPLSIYE